MSRDMTMKHASFRTLPDELRNCEDWPAADVTFENLDDEARFHRMAKGIRLYLKDGRLTAAAKEARCARSTLLAALDRCVQPRNDASQRIVGWAGLIKGLRLTEYKRAKPTDGSQSGGKSGSFKQFLDARPTLRKKLDAIIRAGGGEPGAKSASPVQRGVWKKWVRYCLATGMTENDYPFNTKCKGRRSVERYIQRRIAEDPATSKTWLGADTSNMRNIGTGKKSFPFALAPFDIVTMDTHRVDAIGTLILDGPAGPQEVAIERIHLHVVMELDKTCALGYSVSYSTQINAVAIEDALLCLSTPWKPRALTTEGLSYIPGAALPVGNIPDLDEIRPCAVAFDNAAQHFSNRFLEGVRKQWGCAMNAIPVGSWPRNAAIERVFNTVEQWVFHQLPSSTGSYPTDPMKPDSVQGALKHHISWEMVTVFHDVFKDVDRGGFDPSKQKTPSNGVAAGPKKQLVLRANIQSLEYEEYRREALESVPTVPKMPKRIRPEYSLMPHQLAGLAWMQHLYALQNEYQVRGAVLGDDMGLGKTFQLLALMSYLIEDDPNIEPMLVVAPVSLLENWADEAKKFFVDGALGCCLNV